VVLAGPAVFALFLMVAFSALYCKVLSSPSSPFERVLNAGDSQVIPSLSSTLTLIPSSLLLFSIPPPLSGQEKILLSLSLSDGLLRRSILFRSYGESSFRRLPPPEVTPPFRVSFPLCCLFFALQVLPSERRAPGSKHAPFAPE